MPINLSAIISRLIENYERKQNFSSNGHHLIKRRCWNLLKVFLLNLWVFMLYQIWKKPQICVQSLWEKINCVWKLLLMDAKYYETVGFRENIFCSCYWWLGCKKVILRLRIWIPNFVLIFTGFWFIQKSKISELEIFNNFEAM